jgi:Predicted transcriptional regulator
MTDAHRLILESIRTRRRLRFLYNKKVRIVEPQCYGMGTKGTELLRAHQLQGGEQREPLFDVSKIEDLVMLDETFTKPGPNYKRDDSAMKTIFAQL